MKRNILTLLTGMALGALLTGGAVAAGVMAEPSWQNIYVDGRQVHMTAYNIGGNNFVKLRDIGKEVGFNVYWRGGVQVDSTAPYTGEAPVQAAQAAQTSPAEPVRVSCYKEEPLAVGDGTGLMIYPGGVEYTVTSSDPSIVSVEKALGQFWKANAISPGTATITATGPDGKTGSVVVTVTGSAQSGTQSVDLNANMEIRQEMVRLINQVRRENGAAELKTNEALMNAAQDCASHQLRNHSLYEWQVLRDYGWPHGGGFNLTYFMFDHDQSIAQTAVSNWVHSPGHYQTMLCASATCVGAGVCRVGGMVYCYMAVGIPNSYSPL